MMRLQRYIAVHVLATTFIVIAGLCGIQLIFSFVHESGDIGNGGFNTWQALSYVLLTLPSFLQIMLPMICLLGSLMGLGLLASRSELIAMRASGMSVAQITGGVMIAALVLMLSCLAITAYLGPGLKHFASMRKTMATSQRAVLFTSTSMWLKSGQYVVYIGRSTSPSQLENVVRYDVKNGVLHSILSAKEAAFESGSWHVFDATELTFFQDHIGKQVYKKRDHVDLIQPNLLKVVVLEPDELTLSGLYAYVHYREKNHLDTGTYALQFWQVLSAPLACFILTLLAVPFVFGPLRSATFGLRLVAGIAVGFVFYIVNQFFGSYSLVYHIPPLVGAMLPIGCFAVILLGMLIYIDRH